MSVLSVFLSEIGASIENLEENTKLYGSVRSTSEYVTVNKNKRYFNRATQEAIKDFPFVKEIKIKDSNEVYFLFTKKKEVGGGKLNKSGTSSVSTAWFINLEKSLRFKLKRVTSNNDYIVYSLNNKEGIHIEVKKKVVG